MNKQVKKKWVAALRSGKYKQGREKLCYGNQNGARYCCLGVLSQIAVDEGVCSRRAAFKGNCFLNEAVREWAGLDRNPVANYNGKNRTLANLNDDEELSFQKIAQSINKSL